MKTGDHWNDAALRVLKECYALAAQYEQMDAAREILRAKARKINMPDGYFPAGQAPASLQQSVSKVVQALVFPGGDPAQTGFGLQREVDALPDGAEKEYLQALLELHRGTGESQRLRAIRHISAAREHSPNDPRYIALAEVLQEADA